MQVILVDWEKVGELLNDFVMQCQAIVGMNHLRRMRIKRRRLAQRTVVYYSQLPDPELVAGVAKLFETMIGSAPGEQNLKLIKRNYKERSRETYSLNFAEEIYYVKKFYPLTLRERLKYRRFSPRGVQCFFLSSLLLRAGFAIPEPVFALSYHRKLFHRESIFVTKKCNGISLKEFVRSEAETIIKNGVIHKFAQTLGRFYRKGFIQTDPNFGNFLLDLTPDNQTFVFIDIDAIIYKPYFGSKVVFKSIAKCFSFLYCSLAVNQRTDILSSEKLSFLIKTVLHTYNPHVKIESMAALIKQRIKFNLKRWNHQDYI